MKKNLILLFAALFAVSHIGAATISKKAQQALKAVVNIVTYDADGNILHNGNGFFISADGTAVSEYSLFKGAARAEAIDSRGKKYAVACVMGVNETYDLIKVHVDVEKATAVLANAAPVVPGTSCYVVPASGAKAQPLATSVDSVETIGGGGSYYALKMRFATALASCPVVNENGELIGIIQRSSDTTSTAFAISANMAANLSITAISATSSSLREISIPTAIPEDPKEAVTYLYLLQQNESDSLRYLQALNQYIAKNEQLADGYVDRARYYASHKRYDLCDADLETAFGKEGDKSAVHYAKSKIIYQKNLYDPTAEYRDWTLQRALEEAETAYNVNPLPLYKLMEADCHYGMKDYEKAYQCYEAVNSTSFASPETFYYAARTKEKCGADPSVSVALMDSAISRYSQPYPAAAAPYFLERARYLNAAKEYRRSILDYNEYEHLVGYQNLNDKFYYIREQVALMGRIYQQAIDDIQRAIRLNPKEYIYHVELGALMLRTGQIDEALLAAEDALKLRTDDSDAYKILGIAWGEKGNKAKSLENLNKAKQLGDEQVEELIKQYE